MTTTDQTPTTTTHPLFPEPIGPYDAGEAHRRLMSEELGDTTFLYGYHAAFCDYGDDGQAGDEFHRQVCQSVTATGVDGLGEQGEPRPVYLRFAQRYAHGRFPCPLPRGWDETWVELMGPGDDDPSTYLTSSQARSLAAGLLRAADTLEFRQGRRDMWPATFNERQR